MARFIVSKKLTIQEAVYAIIGLEKWFKENPKRRVCRTETFVVKRGMVGTEVLKHTDLSGK